MEAKKRLQPIGAETKPKVIDSSRQNGLIKRSSFTSEALPPVRGAHGTVMLGTRRSSEEAIKSSHESSRLDGIANGHKYGLPPLV